MPVANGAATEGGYLVASFIQITNGRSHDAILLRTDAEGQLEGATLEEADLHANTQPGCGLGAAKVAAEQLDQAASLKGAVLPDGTVARVIGRICHA